MTKPVIAVVPDADAIARAVEAGGGRVGASDEADGIVWTDPSDVEGLRTVLASSPARWVQLPFAGIEGFVGAGVVTGDRTWTCAKGIYGHATAEHAVALMLCAARLIHEHARRNQWWVGREPARMRRLYGTTALVIGTGGIGQAFARMAQPFGVRILACNRSGATMTGAERTVAFPELASLIGEADFVVLAAPHTPETHNLIDASMLATMQPGAWLINVARGGLVDTDALVDALRRAAIAGAGLDVTDPEPLPADHPLWAFENVIITSHTANTRYMGAPELAALVARNVASFATGEPLEGLVDPSLGY